MKPRYRRVLDSLIDLAGLALWLVVGALVFIVCTGGAILP